MGHKGPHWHKGLALAELEMRRFRGFAVYSGPGQRCILLIGQLLIP